MGRVLDHIALQYRLQYRCHQAQGRRLHVLIWVAGFLVLAAIAGLTVSVVSYINSDLASPVTVPLTLTGTGLSMSIIVIGISRMVAVVPKVLEARNNNPTMPLSVEVSSQH